MRSDVYKLDSTLAMGPVFNLRYNWGLFFNTYHNEVNKHLQDIHTLDSIVYIKLRDNPDRYTAAKVIGIPLSGSDIYTLQHLSTNNFLNMSENRLLTYNPQVTPSDILKDRDNNLPP